MVKINGGKKMTLYHDGVEPYQKSCKRKKVREKELREFEERWKNEPRENLPDHRRSSFLAKNLLQELHLGRKKEIGVAGAPFFCQEIEKPWDKILSVFLIFEPLSCEWRSNILMCLSREGAPRVSWMSLVEILDSEWNFGEFIQK